MYPSICIYIPLKTESCGKYSKVTSTDGDDKEHAGVSDNFPQIFTLSHGD